MKNLVSGWALSNKVLSVYRGERITSISIKDIVLIDTVKLCYVDVYVSRFDKPKQFYFFDVEKQEQFYIDLFNEWVKTL